MSAYRVPDAREKEIMQRNGLDPEQFGVWNSTPDALYLIRYSTRDYVTIYRGDKKW